MRPQRTPATTMTYKLPGHGPEHDLPITRVRQGEVTSEWSLSIAERMAIARGGRVELAIFTEPIPPVSLLVVERKETGLGSVSEAVDDHGPHDTRLVPHDLGQLLKPFGCRVVTDQFAKAVDDQRERDAARIRDLTRARRFWMIVTCLQALIFVVHYWGGL